MDLTISSQHTTLTEPIKEYAEKKLGKLDDRFSFPVKVTLRIRKEGTKREEDRYIAEVTIPPFCYFCQNVRQDSFSLATLNYQV